MNKLVWPLAVIGGIVTALWICGAIESATWRIADSIDTKGMKQ